MNSTPNYHDPHGKEVYLVYRPFADKPKKLFPNSGHYYLAFDEAGLEDPQGWAQLTYDIGPQTNPDRDPFPGAETFSFHPWRVREVVDPATGELISDDSGSVISTFYTEGSFVGYNDEIDQNTFLQWKYGEPLPEGKSTEFVWPLGATQSQQENLYREAILSRNINNFSRKSNDRGWYDLLKFNCGSWAQELIDESPLTWPDYASKLNALGTGVGGLQDKLGLTKLIDWAAKKAGKVKKWPGRFIGWLKGDDPAGGVLSFENAECNFLGDCKVGPRS